MNSGDLGDSLDFRGIARSMGITEHFYTAGTEQRMAAIAGCFLPGHPQSPRSPRLPAPVALRTARLEQATSPKRSIAGAGDAADAMVVQTQEVVNVESSVEDASRKDGSGQGGGGVFAQALGGSGRAVTSLDSASLETTATPAHDDVAVWKHIIAKWQSTKQVMAQMA